MAVTAAVESNLYSSAHNQRARAEHFGIPMCTDGNWLVEHHHGAMCQGQSFFCIGVHLNYQNFRSLHADGREDDSNKNNKNFLGVVAVDQRVLNS